MATPPKSEFHELETYGEKLLTAIGIVSLRAGHLDRHLVFFMSAVGGITHARAESIFYSTVNAKARLDTIRALVGASGFSDARKKAALKLLDRTKRLSDRRNDLIHGQFMISQVGAEPGKTPRPPQRVLVHHTPAAAVSRTTIRPITFKEIEQLARDYASLHLDIWHFYDDVTSSDGPWHGTPK